MIALGDSLAARVFFVLILSQLITSTAADIDFGGSCGGSNTLGDGCSISDDCSTITCKMDFVHKPITLTLKVNKCDDPVSVKATMNVPDLYITWSHTYTSDDIVAVPGFTASIPSVLSAGVYVQVALTPNNDKLRLTVKLLAGGKIFGKGVYPVKATVMKGDLPIDTNACGIFGFWYDMDDASRVAMILGAVIFVLLVITCCCCCCCCCGCCRSPPSNQRTIIVQPGMGPAVMATSTNRTVPMRQPVI